MIQTTQAYKDFAATSNVFDAAIWLCDKDGNYLTYEHEDPDEEIIVETEITFESETIVQGSLRFTDEICNPGDFGVGATVSNYFECEIMMDYPDVERYKGAYAEVHFFPQDSYLNEIQRGFYKLEFARTSSKTVKISGYDRMTMDEYNSANWDGQVLGSSSTTALQALNLVGFDISSFTNSSFIVGQLDFTESGGLYHATARDVLHYVCECIGSYARFNNLGRLEVKQYRIPYRLALPNPTLEETPDVTIDAIFGLPDVDPQGVEITGVWIEAKDGSVKSVGDDGYWYKIVDNPFIKTSSDADRVYNTKHYLNRIFYPMTLETLGDPSLEAGDVVESEVDGKTYAFLVTHMDFTLHDSCTLSMDASGAETVNQVVAQSGSIAFRNVGNSNVPIYMDAEGNPKAIDKQVWESGDTSGNLTIFGYGYCTTTSGTIYSFFPFSKKITASTVEIVSCSGVYIRGVNGIILNNASTVAALNISNIIISENGFRILHTGLTSNWVSSTPISIVGTFKLKFT